MWGVWGRIVTQLIAQRANPRLDHTVQLPFKLWTTRINAACEEHGLEAGNFLEGLQRCDIQLDKKVLTDMAIYEPRTFKSLVEVSKKKLEQEGLASAQMPKPEGVITRGML